MTDYRRIRIEPSYRKLRPSDTRAFHFESKKWIGERLQALKGQKTVVVTHHGVSRQSVPKIYINDPTQPAYTSELTEFILENQPNLWIHGHTHQAFDYKIGNTRVLTNPKGYPHEKSHGFNSDPRLQV
jgi:Icc-related predicted phosphoesterase